MFDVFYREVQYFQPDYGNSYTEPGTAQLYRSFTTEAEAEAAAAGLEFLCGADIYDAWSEEA